MSWKRRRESGADGIEKAVFVCGHLAEGLDVFRASAAAAGVFEPEPRFDLAWHHDASTGRVADVRVGDSLAQAQIHEGLPG